MQKYGFIDVLGKVINKKPLQIKEWLVYIMKLIS